MLSKTRIITVLTLLAVVAAASAFLLLRSKIELIETRFLNNQPLYAEISPDAIQALPLLTASSTATLIPILVYHIVRPSHPNDSAAVKRLAQTPEVFDAQMNYLRTAGYRVISFHTLENHFQNGTRLPTHPIIISFDDGWSNQFQYAFPILKKYQYTATFFVFTNPIGTKGFLTWDNLQTMRNAGMTIASHSRSHPYLTKVADEAALWSEIYDSKKRLEQKLGSPVNEFAYPFGQYNPAIIELVKKAGYASARGDYYTGGTQSADLLYELNAMNPPTTLELFAQKFPLTGK